MSKQKYDSTVARIAGNLLSGYANGRMSDTDNVVKRAVALARDIVAETIRTEPTPPEEDTVAALRSEHSR